MAQCTSLLARPVPGSAAAARSAPAAARLPTASVPRIFGRPAARASRCTPPCASEWDDVPLFGDSSLSGPAVETRSGGKKGKARSVDDVDTTSEAGVDYTVLKTALSEGRFEDADDEHRRLLIELAGPNAVSRGWVYFTEVKTIPVKDMKVLDELWMASSGGKFGFSVQKKIWEKNRCQWIKFFREIYWVQGENDVYLKWPKEFVYETKGAKKGHLPLTNALRGTRLFEEIFKHPAFAESEKDTPAWM